MPRQTLKSSVNVHLQLIRGGEVIAERREHNLVVNTGLDLLVDFLFQSGISPTSAGDPPQAIGIGTGSTAVTATDTTLEAETARAAFDTMTPGGVGVITVDTTFAPGTGTGAITEAGILTDPTSGGTLFSRVVFSAINKAAGDALKVTFVYTIANA